MIRATRVIARHTPVIVALIAAFVAAPVSATMAQSVDPSAAMHWRQIGPTRAGRARAVSGVATQPNVAYAGFDNGGVWRSTDYGSNWEPLFDAQSTGSIGAIAVAPSNPNIIYVGTGAGIIRPDLAVGDGMYKSADAGKTWTHLGLRQSQMIAHIDVDPTNPNRLFVAVLGHPYAPNPERGIFRSTDGGQTFEKVLFKDDYTSGNDVRIDPSKPSTVYAALWEQQQSYIEGVGLGGSGTNNEGNGLFKSTDGGTTWKPINQGLPPVLQANIAIAPSNPRVVYAMVAGVMGAGGGRGGPPLAGTLAPGAAPAGRGAGRGGAGGGGGGVGFYKSTDGGEHWMVAVDAATSGRGGGPRIVDSRPLVRIGGGDLPTITIDPKNENVIYSCSTVFWRTEDGGVTWSAVRGAPGGDDYQKSWVNPVNPNIIILVADQGAVVSGNRGQSWSNWYTQPTAAMYHVSTDKSFPYRVCGGQQDSGSACVDSRSMDGEITFHDWHPVNIQEYGVAAPDPKNPDLVFGSQRTNVSVYDRRTGQTSLVGPSAEQRGTEFGRNVRTMPIAWSPVDPKVLFYTSNVVWKSVDQAHSWTRISPDLARPTWAVPATVGKYASTISPAPAGSITALSPSPRDLRVLWAGTDDGVIQMTSDGGAKWTNVTPPSIKAWTRIFNIDAGHFDSRTAYAAANTFRLDDLNPHFWRTHDGGTTWTEIDNGIAPGAVANAIREDPRQRGLLYAGTDTQVWVSYDDGDHWHSLRLDMPAISVRDLELKDDSTCQCADLVAGTHGRGYYILDNVTPLRHAAELAAAQSGRSAYLVKPAVALRVRFATNDPTPWPPEVPAGENPPPYALIDYYLAANASGPVKMEILSGTTVVRSYTSDNVVVRGADPATDSAKYNTLCQQNPALPDCGLPLYWPAPALTLSAQAGMHRFNWDLRFDPIGDDAGGRGGGGGASGAVPHRTYAAVNAPWAPPGVYTVRLTADGKSYTQPISVKLDPRVKTPATALAQLATLTRALYDDAVAAHAAAVEARGYSVTLAADSGLDVAQVKGALDSLAPPPAAGGGRGGRGGGGGRGGAASSAPPTLDAASNAALSAAMAMQSADVAPTATQLAAAAQARAMVQNALTRWKRLTTTGFTSVNAKRKAAGLRPLGPPK